MSKVATRNKCFHTPESYKEIENWIERHTNADERIHLYTASMMTYNWLIKELELDVEPTDETQIDWVEDA
jgi:hypothetical protein